MPRALALTLAAVLAACPSEADQPGADATQETVFGGSDVGDVGIVPVDAVGPDVPAPDVMTADGASDATADGEVACSPQCDGRECGDDGCGGVCGTCGADATCSDTGSCEAPEPEASVAPTTLTLVAASGEAQPDADVVVTNVGSAPLHITGLSLAGSSGFVVDDGDTVFTAVELVLGVTYAAPLVVAPGAIRVFEVTFTETTVGSEAATLTVLTDDASQPSVDVALTGEIVAPCIEVDPTSITFPDTSLGSNAVVEVAVTSCAGAPVSVTSTSFSGSPVYATTAPNSFVAEPDAPTLVPVIFQPTSEATTSGTLTFTSGAGNTSVALTGTGVPPPVVLTGDIVVTLLWDTPGDANQQDSDGADMDLHFAHPAADGGLDGNGDGFNDPWYDLALDCFWGNSTPNWWATDPLVADDVLLDIDDSDGAGPEQITGDEGLDAATYGIGVHYYDDHGFGPSTATLTLSVGGVVVATLTQTLNHKDFWWVGTLKWPAAEFTADGQVVPNYLHPSFN